MGAVSPVPFVTPELWEKVESRIIRPTVHGLATENIDYKGFLFFGLINVQGDPFVIEYNCRMGDPETEAVFPRLKNNLTDLFWDVLNSQLERAQIEIIPETAATVMLTAGGYPGEYRKGDPIHIASRQPGSLYLHAGTTTNGSGQLRTNGGRILAITSFGNNPAEAAAKSLRAAEQVQFEGKYFRRDIGNDL